MLIFLCGPLIVGGFLVPAHAGILEFFGGLFGGAASSSGISVKNSQNLSLLSAAFHIDPNPSKGGGDITIVNSSALLPDFGPVAHARDIQAKPKSDQISVYVVREGDSLSQIARMFGVTTETIIWANDIGSGGVIHAGETLVILPVSGIQHTVAKGDTLSSIAKKYSASVEDVTGFNDIKEGYTLRVGEKIVIPDGKLASLPSRAPQSQRSVARGTSGPSLSGYYISPISSGRRSQGLHGWNGVDLATHRGAPIFAAAPGEVIISRTGWNGGYGNYVVIAHPNGTQTVYAHNSENIVYVGQQVVQGQVIGYVGSTGRSTGPHVHFEVRGAKNPF